MIIIHELIQYLHNGHILHSTICISFYLWSIALPGNNGTPRFDLSKDEACCVTSQNLTHHQILIERVINKTFSDNSIPLDVSDSIWATFSAKLWRMGKLFARLGTKNRNIQLAKWKEGRDSVWRFTVSDAEINRQLLSRKRSLEDSLQFETTKRKCLEQQVDKLKQKVEQQANVIINKLPSRKVHLRKPLEECSRQQQYNRKKEMLKTVSDACITEGYNPCSLQLECRESGQRETVIINKPESIMKNDDNVSSTLYVKDKFSVSNEAYHELSVLSNLPTLSEVRRLANSLNSTFTITNCPNNTIGVQTSLRARILYRLQCFINRNAKEGLATPDTIRIKLTGDGTRIARSLDVVNIAFTIIDEGRKAQSVLGNYSIAILKVSEKYEELQAGLKDICSEAKDIEVVTIEGQIYRVQFYLGGDLKFLALACGIESANAEHACVWCKCSKGKRADMQMQWSVTDPNKGARSVEEIMEKCKLGKTNKNRYNCKHQPLFPFIPIKQVVIDTLHLFLRISDKLTDLLIRDLRIHDATNTTKSTYLKLYETFINEECKVRFKFSLSRDSKDITYRDFTGPEKVRLFKNINIPSTFPALHNKKELQKLWTDFFNLIEIINQDSCNPEDVDRKAKAWVTAFTSIYQSKDVTPYMHALAMHMGEFIQLHGSVVKFTQQGLEKLNDITTKHFQRATNHQESQSLQQVLEKRLRIESLEERGYQRTKRVQTCSKCKQAGHNKRSCKSV